MADANKSANLLTLLKVVTSRCVFRFYYSQQVSVYVYLKTREELCALFRRGRGALQILTV